MKIAYIAPGFGGTFYCTNCNNIIELARAFRKEGHRVMVTSMYIPFRVDIPYQIESPVFFGAVSSYLKDKYPAFEHMPLWIEKLLDSKPMLKYAAKKSGTTDPKGLETLTLSMMKGEQGTQKDEIERLIKWINEKVQPDIIHLANGLLIGIGVELKKALNIPVFCTLEDETVWLDNMEEPYKSEGWKLIYEGSKTIDGFITPSQHYADIIKEKTGLSDGKVHVISNGIKIAKYKYHEPSFNPPIIGYLSRFTKCLGLDIIADAFVILKERYKMDRLKFRVSGGYTPEDKLYFNEVLKKMEKYKDFIEVDPYLYQNDINNFYKQITLLCVPTCFGEASGVFLMESIACGIPVIEPDMGVYPSIIRNTGSGITFKNNNPEEIAKAIYDLLTDPVKLKQMSRNGRDNIFKYDIENTVEKLLEVYQQQHKA